MVGDMVTIKTNNIFLLKDCTIKKNVYICSENKTKKMIES